MIKSLTLGVAVLCLGSCVTPQETGGSEPPAEHVNKPSVQQKQHIEKLQAKLGAAILHVLKGIKKPLDFYPDDIAVVKDSLQQVKHFESSTLLKSSSVNAQKQLRMKRLHEYSVRSLNILKKNEINIQRLDKSVDTLLELIPVMISQTDELAARMVENKERSDTIYIVTRQMLLLQRIEKNLTLVYKTSQDFDIKKADRFGRDAALLMQVYKDLSYGSKKHRINKIHSKPARTMLNKINQHSDMFRNNAGIVLDNTPEFFQFNVEAQDLVGYLVELRALIL